MQTSSEIIDGLFRKRPVERVGLHDSPWGDTLSKWAAEEGYPKNDGGQPVDAVDVFGFDMACCGGWFDPMPLRGQDEVLEEARIFESGDLQRIRSEVVRLCRSLKDAGARYVFGSDHSISPNVKLADFRFAMDIYRENMMY